MENFRQLEKIEETIRDDIDILYDSTDKDLYRNLSSVNVLNKIYYDITGKKIFNPLDFFYSNEELFFQIDAQHENNNLKEKTFECMNINQLIKTSFLKDVVKEMNGFIISNLKYFQNNSVIDNNIKLSEEEKRKIMNGFLNSNNSSEYNLYDRLMRENRIIFVDKSFLDFRGITYAHANSEICDDSLIFIPKCENDLFLLDILSHELGHLMEIEKLKETSPLKYYSFQRFSLFNEINSTLSQFKFLDYLEKENYPKKEILDIRKKLFSTMSYYVNCINTFLNNNANYEGENVFGDLRYMYGFLMSVYFDSIEDKEELDYFNLKFEQEKIKTNNLEMFNKLDCTSRVLVKSMKNQIKKCSR